MSYQYSPYVIPLMISALISGWVMVYALGRRGAPNTVALAAIGFAITAWLVGYALEIAGADLPTKLFWGKFQYIGIALVPLAWAIFAYYHVNPGKHPALRRILPLFLIPLLTTLLAFTTEMHGLIWETFIVQRSGGLSALAVTYGPWFWVHTGYSYILLVAGTAILVRGLWRTQGLYRGQVVALILAVAAPWIGNIIDIFKLSPVPLFALTPFSFAITVVGLAWAIFGYQLIKISPIARDLLVDNMPEGMIAVDNNGRIADINPAAGRMIGIPAAQSLGKFLAEVLAPWPELVERFRSVQDAQEQIAIGAGEARRYYEVRISALRNSQEMLLGRMITLHALEAGSAPQPRDTAQVSSPAPIADGAAPAQEQVRTLPYIGWFLNFIRAPLKTDLIAPPDINPAWYQARERSFTLILRVAALIGTVALLVAPSFTKLQAGLPFAIIIALIWMLGLLRNINFQFRAITFLVLVYAMASIETYNFGFSAASFTFYMTLVVSANLLLGRNGALVAFFAAVLTLGAFGLQIGSGSFLPINAHEGLPVPGTVQRAITSLLAFSASAAALIASVTILMESLNRAWQMETQVRNLLQQERDMLDQRVTERTRDLAQARDEAIRSSNQLRKYFLAIEQSGNTIFITDTKGRIEYVNPRFTELTGYSLAEATGENPRLLKSGEHDAAFYTAMWNTIRAGQVWHGEVHNRRKDGSLFWESATIAPVQNLQGEITHYVAIKEDITARKKLQEQLHLQNEQMAKEIEERLRAEAQNVAFVRDIKALQEINLELSEIRSQDELYTRMISLSQQRLGLDRIGLFILNPAAKELQGTFGIDPQGQVRDERSYHEAISPDHWSMEIETAPKRAKIWENAPVFDNGQEVGRGWKAAAALWNGQTSLGYLVSDSFISQRAARPYEAELLSLLGSTFGHLIERAQAEARLQESEVRFRQIVETASDVIYRADTEGKLTYANPTAMRVMGYQDATRLVGTHFAEIAAPEYRQQVKRFYYRQFLSKTPSTYYEFPALTDDGREVWLGQNVQIISEGEAVVGFQAVARDITAIKQAQEALSLAHDQALEASRIKSQLLSRVSHELRTPLGSVLGYAELLRDDIYGEMTGEQKEVVISIVESANYLTSLVNDLLDEAQIASKRLSLREGLFSPAELLQQVRARVAVLAQNKGLDFQTELLAPLPATLYGDEKRLQQILVNLAGNAIKFTRAGSIKVQIFQPDAAHWALRVQDTGAGIPKEAQKYIFEPFRQVDNSITRDNRGTGLGLSIVKQLVDLMGGNITLESAPGQGSLFTVFLPIIYQRGATPA